MDDERHQSVPGKKDRKRWCRGKVGVVHKPVCKKYADVKKAGWNPPDIWRLLVCTECGKELACYMPFRPNKKPPAWIT